RDRLTTGIYVPTAEDEPLAELELALQCAIECEPTEARLREATKSRLITGRSNEKISQALQHKLITQAEAELLGRLKELRGKVIKVDDFSKDFGIESGTGDHSKTSSSPSIRHARVDDKKAEADADGNGAPGSHNIGSGFGADDSSDAELEKRAESIHGEKLS
ncbi:MAG: acyl-CoA dehydrogenase domain-containing protein, partial [Nitrosomonas sp.]